MVKFIKILKINKIFKIKIINNTTGLNSKKVIDDIPNVRSKNNEDIIPYEKIDKINKSFFKCLDYYYYLIGN